MPVVAALRVPSAAVEPGKELTCQVDVRNVGVIVDQFTLEVLGPAERWATVEPPVLSLFPNGQQTATIRVQPPREADTPAGEIPFAVKVTPANGVDESVVEESALVVSSFQDVQAELLPKVSTGRISGRHRVAVDSRGNVPVTIRLTGSDPANALRIGVQPSTMVIRPGRARLGKVRVRPRQRFYRGAIRQRPFSLLATPEGGKPIKVDGVLAQRSVLPKGVLVLGVLALAVLLWFFVVRPAVINTAATANSQALAQQQQQNSALAGQLHTQQSQASALAGQLGAVNKKVAQLKDTTTTPPTKAPPPTRAQVVIVPPPPTTTTTTLPPPPQKFTRAPEQGQIEVVAAPGTTETQQVTVPANDSLLVSQVVAQNVSGSTGQARLQLIDGPTNVLVFNLANLTSQQYQLNPSVTVGPGQSLALQVSCDASQTACDVALSFSGSLTEPIGESTSCPPPTSPCPAPPLTQAPGPGPAPGSGSGGPGSAGAPTTVSPTPTAAPG